MIKLECNKKQETTDVRLQVEGKADDILLELQASVIAIADEIVKINKGDLDFEDVIEGLMEGAIDYNAQRIADDFIKFLKELH